MVLTEKHCRKCGHLKPLEAFYSDRHAGDGKRGSCIDCDKARKRTDAVREQSRRYNNSEKGQAAQRRHARTGKKSISDRDRRERIKADPEKLEKHRARMRAAALKYWRSEKGQAKVAERLAKPEVKARIKAYHQEYNQRSDVKAKNRAASLLRSRTPEGKAVLLAYRMRPETVERIKNRHREYLARPDVRARFNARQRVTTRKRESLKRSLLSTLTHDDWNAALDHFGNACAYCGSKGPLEQDHFIPISKGGPYTPDNIVPACEGCNIRKRDKMPIDWCSPDAYQKIAGFLYNT